MFCTKCGHNVPDKNRFCIYCGAPLRTEEQHVPKGETVLSEQFKADNSTCVKADKPKGVREVKQDTSQINNTKVLFILLAAIAAIVLIIILANGSVGGKEAAAEEYIQEYYNGTSVSITDYSTPDEDDMEYFMFILDNEDIKDAIYDVKVSYINEYGESDYTYVDIIYKDSDGWHVAD